MDKIEKRASASKAGTAFVGKVVTYRPEALLQTGEMSIVQNMRNVYPGIRKRRGIKSLDESPPSIIPYYDYCDSGTPYNPSSGFNVVGSNWSGARYGFGVTTTMVPARVAPLGVDFASGPIYTLNSAVIIFNLSGTGQTYRYSSASITLTPDTYLSSYPPGSRMPRICLIQNIVYTMKSFPPDNLVSTNVFMDNYYYLLSDDIIDMNALVSPDKIVFNLNANGLAYINQSGITDLSFGIIEYDFHRQNVTPTTPMTMVGGIYLADAADCNANTNFPVLAGDGIIVNKLPVSIYQYVKSASPKDPPAVGYEGHVFITKGNGDVFKLDNNPPTPSSSYWTQTPFFTAGNLSAKPSWGNINNLLIYSDGYSQHQIWTGEREKVKAVFVCPWTSVDAEAYDIWDKVVDDIGGEVLQAEIPIITSDGGLGPDSLKMGLLFCSQVPIDQLHFKIGTTKQSTVGTYSLFYHGREGGSVGWKAASVTSDSTQATSGVVFSGDGTIAFTLPSAESPTTFFNIPGYWYRIAPTITSGWSEFDIRRVECAKSTFSPLENVWDGVLRDIVEAQVYFPAGVEAEAYFTYPSSGVDMGALPAGGKLFVSTSGLVDEFVVSVGASPNTETNREIDLIEVWNGGSWTEVNFIDTTSAFKNSGRISLTSAYTAEPYRFNGAELASYWFRFTMTYDLSADVFVTFQYVPLLDPIAKEFGSVGVCNGVWKDRAIYTFDRYPSDLYVTASGTPNSLNGSDYAVLSAGDGRKNRINSIKKFHNEIMVWQEEHGKEGGCLTLFEGYSPATFGKLVLSSRVGAVSSDATVVVDGSIAQTTRRDDVVQTRAYWVSRYGIFESDGRTVRRISDDIQNYFDQRFPECLSIQYAGACWAALDSSDNVVRFGIVSGSSSTIPNIFPVYDLTTGTWSFDVYAEENQVVCMTEADSEVTPGLSGSSALQIGCSPLKYFQMNVNLRDDFLPIDAKVRIQMNATSALIDLREFWIRMLTQNEHVETINYTPYTIPDGVCSFSVYENGNLVAEHGESIPMKSLEPNDTIRRERLIKGVYQESNIALELGNNQFQVDLFLYDYAMDYSVLAER